jgi:RNA polymerase sigma factor (sigma-70 family)
MSSHNPMPAMAATALDDPVRRGLADPEVARSLMLLIRASLGRFPAGMTFAQRTSEAEDMFQDVSKHAIASARLFDPQRGRLVNWLGGIVWNLARQRRPARFAVTEPAALAETVVDRISPVPDGVALRLDSQAILDRLPPSDAQLLRLHCEGWTAQEIGEELHLTAGNVRVRLSRLMKHVRGMFENANREADHD